MESKRLLFVPVHNLAQRLALLYQDPHQYPLLFHYHHLHHIHVDDLEHMIYEGFPQVPNHPRLLSEDQVVLGHEETVEAGIVLGRYFL